MRPAVRRLATLVGVMAVACLAPSTGWARNVHVGSLTLHRCANGYPGWCGSIRRALDPGLRGGPTIPIGFEWLPASHPGPAVGTVVAVEGGPGFPSSGSYVEYRRIFGPLLARRNLLLVEQRGTGRSALIRCHPLDSYPEGARASGPRFARIVGECGQALNRRHHTRAGATVHASDLFGTAYATQDLRAVLRRLDLRRVDLYGDSYGSWFVQAFIARFPGVLRSVILDSTYSAHALNPYYASSASSGRTAMDRVCDRDPGCVRAAGGGSATHRLGELLRRLRRRPLRGTVPGLHGRHSRVIVGPRQMADLVQDAGSEPTVLRDLDASVRAALGGDAAPLLRLVLLVDGNGSSSDPRYFSDGMYMAVSCTDYPQLFSLNAPPSVRARQFRAAVRHAHAGAFAPFTTPEWVSMSGFSQPYDICLDWPRPVHHAPVIPAGARPLPASVPLLIIGGDLDDLTPLSDVEHFGPSLGRHVRIVDLVNTVHVTSEGDNYLSDGARCAQTIIRRFVATPARLDQLNTRCAATIPHIQTAGAYPRTFRRARPARLLTGPGPGLLARRAATVAAGAFADAAMYHVFTGSRRGPGLRGGQFKATGSEVQLSGLRFVADARVDGAGTYRRSDGAVKATVTVTVGRRHLHFALDWTQATPYARARIGRAVLSLPAP